MREKAGILGAAAVFLVLPPLARLAGQNYLIDETSRILIYALAAFSLNLIMGYGGMASFGHAAFVGLGGYAVAILAYHQVNGGLAFGLFTGTSAILPAFAAAVLLAAIAGLGIGALSLRTKGVQFIMITLAFAQMIYFFFVSLKFYGGDDGLSMRARNSFPGLDLGNDTTFYYFCLAILGLAVAAGHRMMNARFGKVIQGCRQDERRVVAMGIATYRYKLTCFVIAAALAGLAGALLANQQRYISPDTLHWSRSGELMIMVILGGSGTLLGPIMGAVVLIALENTLEAVTENWMIVLGPILVLVVLFVRGGLWSAFAGLRGAARHG